MWDSYLVGLF